MITIVAMNPALERLYLMDQVDLNVAMQVKSVYNSAGGKGLNAARVAAQSGEQVRAMGFAGGYAGRYLRSLLQDQDIDDDFTKVQGETRSCVNVRNMSNGEHTEFWEPGLPVTDEDVRRFREQYKDALEKSEIVILAGSVPDGVDVGIYSELTLLAKEQGKIVILDTSDKLLQKGIEARPTLVRLQPGELSQLTGIEAPSPKDAAIAISILHKNLGIPLAVVSMGREGSVLACQDGLFWSKVPDMQIVNDAGCGDSLVAGMAAGLRRGYGPEEMLTFATAIATANALSMRTGDIDQNNVDRILPQVSITRF